MTILKSAITVAVLALSVVNAVAQTDQAQLTGRVTDVSGAALPGTTVTIISPRLTEPVVLITDHVGQYNSPPLPAGLYIVVFELTGFESKTRTGLELRAGDVVTLDGHLTVEPVKETVEVIAAAPPPPGPPLQFEAPRPPQTIPVPPEVLASVCGPGQADAITLTVGKIMGHRDEKNRTLFGSGDILVLDVGAPSGLTAGQNYVVRRRFRVGGPGAPAKHASIGQHTAGLIQVVETAPQHAIAVVVYACGELLAGDSVEPFDALPLLTAFDVGTPRFEEPAHVIFGEYGRLMGAPKQLMVIDRGSAKGAERGQRVTIFRRPRGQHGPVSTVADAIVIAVQSDSATIRIERASDAVMVGDLVALHR